MAGKKKRAASASTTPPPAKKRSSKAVAKIEEAAAATSPATAIVPGKAKKLELGLTQQTPFPSFAKPSELDTRVVHAALSSLHADFLQAFARPGGWP